ncbi:MAG: type I-C CRISPR-associated protein Cas5c [Oscillospiraceae bacterium]
MKNPNTIEYKVYGRYGLFSDPITKIGGEKFSYQIPTYQALVGITESIYWKPTFYWIIDSVRVMKKIDSAPLGMRPKMYNGNKPCLSINTYLKDVEYHVRAHFIWNENRPDLAKDRNENKHYFMAKRMIECGGRRSVFLGSSECGGYVESCKFEEGEGAYDTVEEIPFGLMLHGFDYPDNTGVDELAVRLWQPIMKNGVVDFIRPEDCRIRQKLHDMKAKNFSIDENNFSGLEEFSREGENYELDKQAL